MCDFLLPYNSLLAVDTKDSFGSTDKLPKDFCFDFQILSSDKHWKYGNINCNQRGSSTAEI